jgi:hypothetical protein
MKMVSGSSGVPAVSDPAKGATSTKPEARYIACAVVMNRSVSSRIVR